MQPQWIKVCNLTKQVGALGLRGTDRVEGVRRSPTSATSFERLYTQEAQFSLGEFGVVDHQVTGPCFSPTRAVTGQTQETTWCRSCTPERMS